MTNAGLQLFTYLKLRREHKESYMEVGESKVWISLRIINKVMCSLEVVTASFKG